jgi:PKD repeat protein
MRNRAYLLVALLGLLTFALTPGFAAAAGKGQNLTEIALASEAAARASAVSGPVIDVTPLSINFGHVNVGGSTAGTFTVRNTGDANLSISSVVSSNPRFSPGPVSSPIPAGGSAALQVTYNATTGTNDTGTITVNSNATNGPFRVNVSGQGNAAPTLNPIGNKQAFAFVELSFTTTASDANDQIDDRLTFSVAPAPPPGATYDAATGEFRWTPSPGDAGSYQLTFCVQDESLQDCETITITVTAENQPPLAVAGGPYSGGVNQDIQFDGSGSSDPDGNNLAFDWDFGDNSAHGSGATPTHAYAAANNYLVTLTVTDDGSPSLSDSDVASVEVLNVIPANIAAKLSGGALRVTGGGASQMGIEINARPVTDIETTSIRMSTTFPGAGTASEISPDTKGFSIGDIDHDGVVELDFYFSRAALNQLLGNVPNNTTVELIVRAATTAGAGSVPIQGSLNVRIKNTGGGSVSASASPNPFNPATKIAYTLKRGGPVSVRIYSIDGRLVRTLKDEVATAGSHEVLWDGMDHSGRPVRSGMYFVKTASAGDVAIFKLSLLK